MCGIWALFGYDQSAISKLQHAFLIAHRGPDSFRVENIPHFQHSCIAFHRLSILDDIGGQQPLKLHHMPHLHLMYNGEIYNFKDLGEKYGFQFTTEMDGEVILHLYHKFGAKKTAQLLDGVFAFIIIDTEKSQVHIGRDTFGVRPMFLLQPKTGELGICSEAKGLVGLVQNNGIQSELTAYPPGRYSSYNLDKSTGKVKLYEEGAFTDVDVPEVFDINISIGEDVNHNIRELLTYAIGKRLMADRRIGCLLSGGLDSSLVAALVVKLAHEKCVGYPIQTFATGMPGSTDLAAARKVADMLGTEHHEILFTPEDGCQAIEEVVYSLESYDIITVRASIGMNFLCKYISEKTNTVVIFSGEGADELLQGYLNFHKAPTPAEAHAESIRLLRDLYLYDGLRADRITSAHGLELRVPFLDKAFTNYCLSLPTELRQPQKGIEKYLFRSSFDGHLQNLLPDEILWRPKEGFSDGISSLEKPWFVHLQEYAATKVTEEEFALAKEAYPFNTPTTKEAFYYRKCFEKDFVGQSQLIPYSWMPKWIVGMTNPSARTMKHYKQ